MGCASTPGEGIAKARLKELCSMVELDDASCDAPCKRMGEYRAATTRMGRLVLDFQANQEYEVVCAPSSCSRLVK